MAEIKQININNATYDINLPSGVSVDVKAVKAAGHSVRLHAGTQQPCASSSGAGAKDWHRMQVK